MSVEKRLQQPLPEMSGGCRRADQKPTEEPARSLEIPEELKVVVSQEETGRLAQAKAALEEIYALQEQRRWEGEGVWDHLEI